jgi:excinuclease UvrABC ATPase subunit
VHRLNELLQKLRDKGNSVLVVEHDPNTVIVIEHHMDVMRNADCIIDLGPEGGNKGGRVVFEARRAACSRREHR